ncbi:hypothetical protein [Streptomyces yaizuensis]|uniref:GerMN domain-containing protein n=1 Tax=Streptomyces yaizuensis TaxID=2989713 RepID=A0ABQ5PB39_9ACTN|nr:hypothetical protein [Streptomyces sp. YSPA8]GLF99441.1 GerMN domain-containing protein [Streptomyces sp. YSPA8]
MPPARRTPRTPRTALTGLAAALLTTGCGVPPTGVLDGGDPAGGLTQGMRLYFVSHTGRLKPVPRPDIDPSELKDPGDVIELLGDGPSETERATGLTTLVPQGPYAYTPDWKNLSIRFPAHMIDPSSVEGRNLMGQLVCSIARGRILADGDETRRMDDVPVRVAGRWEEREPYVCSDFLK